MNNENVIAIGISVVAVLFAAIALFAPGESNVGGTTQSYWDAQQGFRVNGTEVISSSRQATFAGTLNVPTVASATTTLVVGEIETYATSSATKVCLKFATTGATSTFNGTTYWNYGACP